MYTSYYGWAGDCLKTTKALFVTLTVFLLTSMLFTAAVAEGESNLYDYVKKFNAFIFGVGASGTITGAQVATTDYCAELLKIAQPRFGTTCSSANWDSRADYNKDKVVNINDLTGIAALKDQTDCKTRYENTINHCTQAAPVDLEVVNISASTAYPSIGYNGIIAVTDAPVTFTAHVKNKGGSTVSYNLKYSCDISKGTITRSIAAGANDYVTFNCLYGRGEIDDTIDVTAEAIASGDIDASNNRKYREVIVVSADEDTLIAVEGNFVLAESFLLRYIGSGRLTDSSPEATFKNLVTGDRLKFPLTPYGSTGAQGSIKIGGRVHKFINITDIAGNFDIKIDLNGDGKIGSTVIPTGRPDVTVTSIAHVPISPKVGEKISFTATIVNVGNAAAKGLTITDGYVCGSIAGSRSDDGIVNVINLLPNQVYSHKFTYTIDSPGTCTVTVTGTTDGDSNSANNKKEAKVEIQSILKGVDIGIRTTSVTSKYDIAGLKGSIAFIGKNESIVATIINVGSIAQGGRAHMNCGIGKTSSVAIPVVNVGATITVSENICKYDSNGEYRATVSIDITGDVNTDNNAGYARVWAVNPDENTALQRNDYFVLGGKHLLRYKGADRTSASDPTAKFQDVVSGETIERLTASNGGASIKLGGNTYLFAAASEPGVNDYAIKVDLNGDGAIGGSATYTTCTDSDGGNNYFVRGTVESCIYNNNVAGCSSVQDLCNGHALTEYSCASDNTVRSIGFQCANGCSKGACIKQQPDGRPESWLVQSSSEKLSISEIHGAAPDKLHRLVDVVSTVGSTQMPNLLGDGTMNNGTNKFAYSQELSFGHGQSSYVALLENPDTDVTGRYLYFKNGGTIAEYRLHFNTPARGMIVNDNINGFIGQTLRMLGKNYVVLDATVPGNGMKLVLLANPLTGQLKEGESRTYTVLGNDYDVTASFIGNGAKFVVNGQQTLELRPGESYGLADGAYIALSSTFVLDYAGGIKSAEFYLSPERVELSDTNVADKVSSTSLSFNHETIDGTAVTIQGSVTGLKGYSRTAIINDIILQVNADDDLFVPAGGKLSKQLEEPGALLNSWDIQYAGLDAVPKETVDLRRSGNNQILLQFVDADGNPVSVPLASLNGSSVKIGDADNELILVDDQIINRNDYFILTYNGKSYAMRYVGADRVTSDTPTIRFRNLGNGETLNLPLQQDGSAVINIGGNTFKVQAVGDTTSNDFDIKVDLDGDGRIGLSVVDTAYGGAIVIQSTPVQVITKIGTSVQIYEKIGGVDITVATNMKGISPASDPSPPPFPTSYQFRITSVNGNLNMQYAGTLNLLTPDGESDTLIGLNAYGAELKAVRPAGNLGITTATILFPERRQHPLVYVSTANVDIAGPGGILPPTTSPGPTPVPIVPPVVEPVPTAPTTPVASPLPLPSEQERAYEGVLEMKPGWNLMSSFLTTDEVSITQNNCAADNIVTGFYFNPSEKNYRSALGGDLPVRIKDYEANGKLNSMWIKSTDSCSIQYRVNNPDNWVNQRDGRLAKGWNLLGVVPDMVGRNLNDMRGSCQINRAQGWNPDTKGWENVRNTRFSSPAIGHGFAINVAADCVLGVGDVPPPLE
jgi:hypothetical protein